MLLERQVICNSVINTDGQQQQPHNWFFVIVNEEREIQDTRQKILRELSMADDLTEINHGLIAGSGGLHALYLSFISEQGTLNFNAKKRIYAG